MAFKLAEKTAEKIVRAWPVTIQEPIDGGKTTNHKVEVDYVIVSEADKDALIQAGGDEGFLQHVVRGWKYFKRADDSEAPCDDETKASFFDVHFVRAAVIAGYFQAASGGRRKN